MDTFSAEVDELKQETKDVFTISLKGTFPKFKAGQYFFIISNGVKRPYSIASSPLLAETQGKLKINFKVIPKGPISNYLAGRKKGDKIELKGPFGMFNLKNEKDALVFLGTGTGVAPLKCMINYLLDKNTEKDIWLIFGVKQVANMFYVDEFKELEKQHNNFHFIPSLTREEIPQTKKGRVQEVVGEIIAEGKLNPKNSEAYICGLNEMVSDCRKKLEELGFEKQNIHFERYD